MKRKKFFNCVATCITPYDKISGEGPTSCCLLVQSDDFKSAMEKFYQIAHSGDIGEQVKLQSISESNMVIYVE